MSPRINTTNTRLRILAIGVLVLLAVLAIAMAVPVPLVALGPGPTFDVLGQTEGKPVITVNGHPTYPTTGHLNMVTVSVSDGLTAANAVQFWLSSEQQLVPRAEIYPPGLTNAQVTQSNNEQFSSSESDATAAALRYLHEPLQVVVAQTTSDSPAGKALSVQDRLLEVNGQPISSATQVRVIMSRTRPGDQIPITYQRGGAPPAKTTVTAGVRPADAGGESSDGPKGFLGIVAHTEPIQPNEINVALNDVGGPSAGLMFALGITDKITPADLAGGKFIAGTGTIDEFGKVGPIGGIGQKMIGARKAGATVFLVPADNCVEAKGAGLDGLQLIKVGNLGDAVTGLDALKSGKPVPGC